MKIAGIIHSLDGGGAERVMAGLANRLIHRGHQFSLITLDDGAHNRHGLDPAVTRIPLSVMTQRRGWVSRLAGIRRRLSVLRSTINQLSPDIVLSFCDRNNVLTLLATGGTRVPVVVSERSDPRFQTLGFWGEQVRRHAYARAARLVALNDSVAGHIQSWHAEPVSVIPSAVDRPPIVSDRRLAAENRLILGVGRLEIEKGFDRLIQAFAKFHREEIGRDWKLRILGDGSQRGILQKLIADTGITDVAMPGWSTSVWDEMAGATLFVLPSRYEGFPSALLEAMAVGVPCVSVDCPSGPEVILRHESNGLLVESSIDGLHDAIKRMACDPETRERLGQAAPEVLDRFSWDSMVDAYESLLCEVVTANKRR